MLKNKYYTLVFNGALFARYDSEQQAIEAGKIMQQEHKRLTGQYPLFKVYNEYPSGLAELVYAED